MKVVFDGVHRARAAATMLLLAGLVFSTGAIAQYAGLPSTRGKAEHIVVVVWDGMRPDFISLEHTPALHRLAQEGVRFQNHHSVYLSSTEVNATAIATGMHPENSGIVANKEFRPAIDALKPVSLDAEEVVRWGDELEDGHFLAVPTLVETLQRAGYRTAVAGTKAAAILFDRSAQRTSSAAQDSVDFCKGLVLPVSAIPALERANGKQHFPTNITYPNFVQDAWTTKALTDGLWSQGVPKFSLLWLSDPDYTQHEMGVGSPASLAALESADRNLGLVLGALEAKFVLEKTDVFVASDHGFSTIQPRLDVAEELVKAGFPAVKALSQPAQREILVVSLSGSVSLYVPGHDEETIRKLASYLQTSDFAGVIFSRLPLAGTFPLEQVRIQTTNAPDLLVSLRWNSLKNEYGARGLLTGDTTRRAAHASLSPFDMQSLLVASGPDLRREWSNPAPTGNTDLAPTILWLLGVKPAQSLDGRILSEALRDFEGPLPPAEQVTIEASAEGASFRWCQYLKYSTVGNAIYFEEGNGAALKKATPPSPAAFLGSK